MREVVAAAILWEAPLNFATPTWMRLRVGAFIPLTSAYGNTAGLAILSNPGDKNPVKR